MPIIWDSPLVAALAAQLRTELLGDRLRAVHLDGKARLATLFLRRTTLVASLHPARSSVRLLDASDPFEDALPLSSTVVAVHAPTDDRLLFIDLRRRNGGVPVRIAVEFLRTQMNLVVTEGPESRIRHTLRPGTDRRKLQPGSIYSPPAPTTRLGREGDLTIETWNELLAAPSPEGLRKTLLSQLAWTSSLNVESLIEQGDQGYEMWLDLATLRRVEPVLLESAGSLQPYPIPLTGVEDEPTASLLEAMARVAQEEGHPTVVPPAARDAVEHGVRRARRHLGSLERELAAIEDPEALRAIGDLLLARLRSVRAGSPSVDLEGFDGALVSVELDSTLSPSENAAKYYDRAGRASRARSRLPSLISVAKRSLDEALDTAERMNRGEINPDELARLAEVPVPRKGALQAGVSLPYRRFKSTGGLEIRVGRGDKKNDDLTFHHSHPNDVWLHARHSAGAHVVLRWNDPSNPPHRDLTEAAGLAALHSKARTSGTVPVDWTRRKYVRRPRKSKPGSVLVERAQTVFVEPNSELVARLRWPEDSEG